ncbi:MAG TPA: hypothetical protein VGV61_16925 [Thermoanaerobaculia bacterium]|jgi:hypothetical protein|nr:hypothetical protein [Thermoanaerobaculia bacterium]
MRRLLFCVLPLLVALAAARPLAASCGSALCPIDTHALNLPETGGWALDLSFQYIDQDQPRIGTRDAHVGELSSEHDEVRTINRTATAALRHAFSDGLHVGVVVPWVSRFHEHIEESVEGQSFPGEVEKWSYSGVGDVALETQAELWSHGRTGLWLTGAVELPTGQDDRSNSAGEVAELPIQTGSGSTDFVVGGNLRGSVFHVAGREGAMGRTAAIPWFASVTYRRNGRGRDDYRLGDEWQASAGTAYPLSQRLEALLQLNARRRGEDDPGKTQEDPRFTGGRFLFASPGARLALGERWAGYLYLQLPLYQDVNRLQLTARRNWLWGIQGRW